MKKKPLIGLVGYFGWGNFGDELFLSAHREHLSPYYDMEVVHDILEEPYLSPKALANLSKFDGFLIGGGDLLNPNAVSSLYWRKEYLEKPVFIHGIGCPVLKVKASNSINYYKTYFSHDNIKHICLRDIESKNYFDEVVAPKGGTVTYPDAVCALTLPPKIKTKEKILGVILRSHRSLVGDYSHLRRAADEAKDLGYKVKLIVGGFGTLGNADLEVTKIFAKEGEEVVFSDSLPHLCQAISECTLVLSMKFHGLIVGTMYGVPVIQLSTTQKNKNVLRYLQRPDLIGNYNDPVLFRRIPPIATPIHSLLVQKLRRDATAGYAKLIETMNKTYSIS